MSYRNQLGDEEKRKGVQGRGTSNCKVPESRGAMGKGERMCGNSQQKQEVGWGGRMRDRDYHSLTEAQAASRDTRSVWRGGYISGQRPCLEGTCMRC